MAGTKNTDSDGFPPECFTCRHKNGKVVLNLFSTDTKTKQWYEYEGLHYCPHCGRKLEELNG